MTAWTTEYYALELDQDVAISVSNATQGAHRTHSFIPGSVLLGVVASHCYKAFPPETQWRVFHAGAVQFGPAYPLSPDGAPALPVPLAWHTAKGATETVAVYNLAAAEEAPEGVQPAQMRETYIAPVADGRVCQVAPRLDYRQMTAIDRTRFGATKDGALFGMSKIRRGQRFWFRLRFAGDLDSDATQRIRQALTSDTLRLGRSRSAENGAVRITPMPERIETSVKGILDGNSAQDVGQAVARRIQIYLFSDLVPPHGDGPPLPPGVPPSLFGLDDNWQFCPERSFLRSARWSPFNGKRRLFDAERQAWQRGSVLTFCAKEGGANLAETVSAARTATADGIGRFRAEGLGQVLVAPAFLAPAQVQQSAKQDARRPETTDDNSQPPEDSSLFKWAKQRVWTRRLPLAAGRLADAQYETVQNLYCILADEARRSGRPLQHMAPPPAQWSKLDTELADWDRSADGVPADLAAMRARLGLDKDATEGFCAESGRRKVWHENDTPCAGEGAKTFADILARLLSEEKLDTALDRLQAEKSDAKRVALAQMALRRLAHWARAETVKFTDTERQARNGDVSS